MRYFACVVVFFCFCINTLYGQQNLVLNPSFEDVIGDQSQCRLYLYQIDFDRAINNWKSASNSADIFHMNLPESCRYNPRFAQDTGGYQLPRTGNSMVGFINYINPLIMDPSISFPMEMIEGQLSTPLIAGNTYRIRFYVLLADYQDTATNNFGIKFFENSYTERTVPVTRGDVDANYTEVITDKQNWRLVELEFTPQTSNLQYFIIGNFFYSSDTMTQLGLPTELPELSYYFIDDVSVVNISNLEFDELGPFCQGFSFSLPTQTMHGNTGDWFPAINNQETTTYTFTPHNPDIDPITLTIEITEAYIEPVFDLITTLCEGSSLVLPSISENGIAGTWSPQVNNQETTVYTFTPEVGSCGLETTVMIEISNKIQPEFDIPSIVCVGTTITLPSVSENGITGIWSPEINNQKTTTYTFTPEAGSCALETSVTIEVIGILTPEFDLPSIVCVGMSIVLPSISENGITGTWFPKPNSQETTTYTFTPEEGSCALETSVTIEVVDILTPEFTIPFFICQGSSFILPEVSDNGIRGIWSPAVNNQQTTRYTFTPVGQACAVPVTVTVEVERIDTPLLNSYCTKNELYVEVVHPDLENQFQWQINGIAIDELSPLVNLSKHANLLHDHQNIVTVSMTNTLGCVITNTIEIENKYLCFIPKGISPQGDGLNETFNISHFGGVSFQVFNRYGMKVYDKKNYKNEWFGQTNSNTTLLPSGTYFYQIVTNKGETLSGWVQLVY